MAATASKKSVYEVLSKINVDAFIEKKNGLSYLSWAFAWAKVKENYPEATFTIYETDTGCFYFTDGRTCWVKTGVTIEGLEHIEYLPVMDYRNNSITLDKVTSFDVNKAIQRSLTKACARHGLGLSIYAGEDLTTSATNAPESAQPTKITNESPKSAQPQKKASESVRKLICSDCGNEITARGKNTPAQIASASKSMFGAVLCFDCAHNKAEQMRAEKAAKEKAKAVDMNELVEESAAALETDPDSGLPFPIE